MTRNVGEKIHWIIKDENGKILEDRTVYVVRISPENIDLKREDQDPKDIGATLKVPWACTSDTNCDIGPMLEKIEARVKQAMGQDLFVFLITPVEQPKPAKEAK